MQISFDHLITLLESTGIEVYRDEASTSAEYPYIIFEFVNVQQRRSSNKVFVDMPLYQIAYVTGGVETEIEPLKKVFNDNNVAYEGFTSIPYDENDDKITQFITYVRCVNG